MNLKKIKIIAPISIFLLSFIAHFAYELFPNFTTSILFPVNESIFEHMKIIFTSTLIYGIIEYLILKKYNIKISNYLFQLFITSILSIVIFLIIYLPIHFIIGEYLILTLIILFITYIISSIISYYLLSSKHITSPNITTLTLIIITYLIFGILTYYPPNNYFFYDTLTDSYGIPKEHVTN